jgi:hypothetical protein
MNKITTIIIVMSFLLSSCDKEPTGSITPLVAPENIVIITDSLCVSTTWNEGTPQERTDNGCIK